METITEPTILRYIRDGKATDHKISGWDNAIQLMQSWSNCGHDVSINTAYDIIEWAKDLDDQEFADRNMAEAVRYARMATEYTCFVNDFGNGWRPMTARDTALELASVAQDADRIEFI